jgi:flagellar biosynthesis protein FliQ
VVLATALTQVLTPALALTLVLVPPLVLVSLCLGLPWCL